MVAVEVMLFFVILTGRLFDLSDMMKDIEILAQEQKLLWIRVTSRGVLAVYACALFALPLVLSWPQIVIGSVVNFLLILAAFRYKNAKTMIPLVMLPSIAAVMHGMIFGHFSSFLVYMMPAIRIGNYLLVYIVQHDANHIKWILTWALVKSIFLALVASLLIYSWILPAMFLKAMGLYQLLSVLVWGAWAFVLKNKLP